MSEKDSEKATPEKTVKKTDPAKKTVIKKKVSI